MKITLYQIIPEPENRYLIFSDLRSIRAASGGHVPAEIYEAVFSGDLDIAVPRNAKNKMDQELAVHDHVGCSRGHPFRKGKQVLLLRPVRV